ncbi:hypothetical protein [Streptomyces sp. NPDC058861]|uniref:hypothetical protein n=1 Tax=Streptomyces sp. NPDC058861 TaxID=3346653 RepID=UPI0036771079
MGEPMDSTGRPSAIAPTAQETISRVFSLRFAATSRQEVDAQMPSLVEHVKSHLGPPPEFEDTEDGGEYKRRQEEATHLLAMGPYDESVYSSYTHARALARVLGKLEGLAKDPAAQVAAVKAEEEGEGLPPPPALVRAALAAGRPDRTSEGPPRLSTSCGRRSPRPAVRGGLG